GRPRAVDGRRSRIFQHREGSNILGVEVVDVVHRQAVHHVERAVAVDGRYAPNENLRRSAGLRARAHYRYAGGLALQRRAHVAHRQLRQFRALHGSYGVGNGALFLRAEANYHGLVEGLGTHGQAHRHGVAAGGHLLLHVADRRNNERGADRALRYPQRKLTVGVGGRANGCTFQHHRYAGQARAFFIEYGAAHGRVGGRVSARRAQGSRSAGMVIVGAAATARGSKAPHKRIDFACMSKKVCGRPKPAWVGK
nr:hypothetical protein [Tanacetum cinerariifolium]